ncbi:transcriptional regulator [Kitasatospora herbaricolor]|uniref:ROK family transcriptional regulator n=1 Tax=Kitasatospora herbaricolor TaxID=68217 RepID=UPI001748F6D9|nr:ROK family transcriptional regulator [Kitasatospora herbaricolor]MDQ0305899.1 putative NBD/HSP70 family sugar kinase [Kitasatospora herbaricolor]GGV38111.1 transcriptional regulator [Kitasatospora herbaricolor]
MVVAEAARGPHVLRRMNGAAVLAALRAAGTDLRRVSEIAVTTGLSRPAVTRALSDLTGSGLVEELDSEDESTRQVGRPARMYRFRARAGHVCGIDIGPHKVLAVVSDLAGRPAALHRENVPAGTRGTELVTLAQQTVLKTLRAAGVKTSDLWATCVGTPGIVDRERGVVIQAPSIPGWAGLSVAPTLQAWLECPVYLDNDVTLAVLAERATGIADDDNLVLVHWGERIGTGIVIDGKPYRGSSAAAGELGFIDLSPATEREHPTDGVTGPAGLGAFEALVGADAIRTLGLAAYGQAGTTPPRGLADTTTGPQQLFEAARRGDPVAQSVVDRVAADFAHGLSVLLLLLDPGRVIIGGGLSIAGESLLAPVRHHLARHILLPANVVASTLGDRAVAQGATLFALEQVEARISPQVHGS